MGTSWVKVYFISFMFMVASVLMDIMVSMILDIRSNTAKEQYFYTKCEYKNLKGVKCVAVIRRNHDMMRDLLQEDFEQMYNKSKKQWLNHRHTQIFSPRNLWDQIATKRYRSRIMNLMSI
eukprot:UN05028